MKRLGELSDIVGGQLTTFPDLEISGASSVSRAGSAEITFVTSEKYFQEFLDSDAAAAVVPTGIETTEKPCIQVENVEAAFIEIAEVFKPLLQRKPVGISPQAIVSPTADIGDDVCVYPGAVIMDNVKIGCGSTIFPNVTIMENCEIGSQTRIFPGAVLYENTVIGSRTIIHSGVVLGAFGFGYKSNTGRHLPCSQIGNVVIGDDVEIGSNSTIDRGTFDSTTIGSGTKIDDLVMIGHNCVVGEHNILCSQVGVAGSCTTGNYVIMGGQVGMADHLNIGSNVSIGAKSGLMHDIAENQKFFGIPARPAREEMQLVATRAKLPEMRKSIKKLEKQVAKILEEQATATDQTKAA